jgi:hypothetical protein
MNARQELESLAREIAEVEGYSLSLARWVARSQHARLEDFAVSWDSWVAEQQREVNQACNTTLIGEQHAV